MEESETILVGLGKYAVSHNPASIASLGLGSCVAVTLFDPTTHTGGLAHIMLPSMDSAKSHLNVNKFADQAIGNMVNDLVKLGVRKSNLIAKLAGGAHMFKTLDKKIHTGIGESNLEAVRKKLRELGIRIVSEDTGGNLGRTVYLNLTNGEVSIKTKDYIKVI